MGRLREEYIETGKVRFVYKQFPILGPQSIRVSEASECAAEQDQFWAYHDLFFQNQAANRNALDDARLTSLAAEIGLDTAAFEVCLTSGRYTNLIAQDTFTVQSLGVRGTPGFAINGVYLAGAQPYETFQQIIEEQLVIAGFQEVAEPEATK